MKHIEFIKLIIALILLFIVIFIASIFFLEINGFLDIYSNYGEISHIFRADNKSIFIFLGFCAISGAYLLNNVKPNKK
jgi:hypothetical protein